jgi:protein-disulfide isomerase
MRQRQLHSPRFSSDAVNKAWKQNDDVTEMSMVEPTVGPDNVLRRLAAHWRVILDTAATLSIIAVSVTLVWVLLSNRRVAPQASAIAQPNAPSAAPSRPAPVPPPKEPVSLGGATLLGDQNARVAIIEYSDFQCPYCAAFARDTLPGLIERYIKTGKVILAFRHLPLNQIHPFANKAAEAAECAGRQGKFWEMHDAMFENQQQLDERSLQRLADRVDLEPVKFSTCLKGQAARRVEDDTASAVPLGVSGTPTFFLGTIDPDGRVKVAERLTGALPAQQFTAVLDRLLASSKSE